MDESGVPAVRPESSSSSTFLLMIDETTAALLGCDCLTISRRYQQKASDEKMSPPSDHQCSSSATRAVVDAEVAVADRRDQDDKGVLADRLVGLYARAAEYARVAAQLVVENHLAQPRRRANGRVARPTAQLAPVLDQVDAAEKDRQTPRHSEQHDGGARQGAHPHRELLLGVIAEPGEEHDGPVRHCAQDGQNDRAHNARERRHKQKQLRAVAQHV
eukprot:4299505-Pleurochrysis_carterae.AAC.1